MFHGLGVCVSVIGGVGSSPALLDFWLGSKVSLKKLHASCCTYLQDDVSGDTRLALHAEFFFRNEWDAYILYPAIEQFIMCFCSVLISTLSLKYTYNINLRIRGTSGQ